MSRSSALTSFATALLALSALPALGAADPPAPAEGSDAARTVLERMRGALLGDRHLNRLHYSAKVTLQTKWGPVDGTVREWLTADGRLRREVDLPFASVLTTWDGSKGAIGDARGSLHELPKGPQIEVRRTLQRQILLLASTFEQQPLQLRLVGTEEVDGHPCDVVAVRTPDGEFQLYVDRETGLPRKRSHVGIAGVLGPKQTIETFFSDWREVRGIQVPYFEKTLADGKLSQELTREVVEIDPDLSDSLFEPPGPLEPRD